MSSASASPDHTLRDFTKARKTSSRFISYNFDVGARVESESSELWIHKETLARLGIRQKMNACVVFFSLCPSWFPIFSLPALVDVSRWHVRYFKIYIYVLCIWKCVKTLNVVSREKLRMGDGRHEGDGRQRHGIFYLYVRWKFSFHGFISLLLFWQHIVRLIITEIF